MTPVEHAESRGHVMGEPRSYSDLILCDCTVCGARLAVNEKNPHGWGLALSIDCRRDVAA